MVLAVYFQNFGAACNNAELPSGEVDEKHWPKTARRDDAPDCMDSSDSCT